MGRRRRGGWVRRVALVAVLPLLMLLTPAPAQAAIGVCEQAVYLSSTNLGSGQYATGYLTFGSPPFMVSGVYNHDGSVVGDNQYLIFTMLEVGNTVYEYVLNSRVGVSQQTAGWFAFDWQC